MLIAAEQDVRWCVQPVSSDDLTGLRGAHAVAADVTAGEYGYELSCYQWMCEAGAVDRLQAEASRRRDQRVAARRRRRDLQARDVRAP